MKSVFVLALAGLGILFWSTPAQAKLQIENVQACYGPFGPERKAFELYPFDNLFVRFTATGLKTDAAGKADTTVKLKLVDAKGNVIGDTSFGSSGVLNLGGESFLVFVNLRMQDQVPVGKNSLTLTITDNLSKETASVERPITGKKGKLQIVALEFFHDPDGKLPASTNGALGERLHFRLRVIGYDRSKEKIHTELAVQTLDADGKENLPKPMVLNYQEKDARTVLNTGFVFFTSNIGLNRVGKFTLRITVTDRITNQSTKLEVPVTVTAP
jgi:hypothetical protein